MLPLVFRPRGLFGKDVSLDIAGIRRGKTVILWDDLAHYVYRWTDANLPGDFVAVSRSGAEIVLAPFFDRWDEVAARFLTEAHRRLREPDVRPFAFDGDTLTCGQRRIAIRDVAHVEIAAIGTDVVAIVHERNAGAWAEYHVAQIACFWRWLEMLVERDVTLRSELGLHVAHLDDVVARDERLPSARLL